MPFLVLALVVFRVSVASALVPVHVYLAFLYGVSCTYLH